MVIFLVKFSVNLLAKGVMANKIEKYCKAEFICYMNIMEKRKKTIFSVEKLISCSKEGVNNEISNLNKKISPYGLYLTQNDVREIVRARTSAMTENCRMEIGIGSIEKIVDSIITSRFINRSNFRETLCALLRTFYYIKTASYDSISDDDLVRVLKDVYENVVYGSLENMEGREVDIIMRYIETEKKRKTEAQAE